MSKRLLANGNTGLVSISDPDADIINPLSNLNKIYFHSDLEYLFVRQTVVGSLSLPFRQFNSSDASGAFGSTVYTIATHNLGYTPLVFGFVTGTTQSLVGETILQAAGTANIRTIMLGADSTVIYAREIFLNKTISFSAITLNFTIQVLNDAGV